MGYINLVKNRASYKLNMREQQWLQRDDIKVGDQFGKGWQKSFFFIVAEPLKGRG